MLSEQDIRSLIRQCSTANQIQEQGQNSVVYHVDKYAVKIVTKSQHAEAELAAYTRIAGRHSNVLPLEGYLKYEDGQTKHCFVLPWKPSRVADVSELQDFIRKMREELAALGVIVQDSNTSNVLVSDKLYLVDFGKAKLK